MYDIFISFSFKDEEKAKHIAGTLERDHGISYWMCTRDIRAGARYKAEIVKGIKSAKAFVLILSSNAVRSGEIPKELSIALERRKTVIPFVIDEMELDGELEYDLTNIERLDGTVPTLEERVAELAAEIEKVIMSIPDFQELTAKSQGGLPALRSSRMMPNERFLGREAMLQELRQKMERYGKVFLRGIGGIGKSELAKQYAIAFKDRYDTVLFATYEASLMSMLINDSEVCISNFEKAAGESDEEYFRRKLSKLKQLSGDRTLFIIDNFDTDSDPDFKDISSGSYDLLITTRNDHEETGIPVVTVEELDEQEQMELFRRNFKRPLKPEDVPVVEKILQTVQGHTLTIELIAKLMQTRRIRPGKMLDNLTVGLSADAMRQGSVSHGFDSGTVYGFITRLFNISSLSQGEKKILACLSLMPLEGIEYEDFAELNELEDYEELEGLIKKNWVICQTDADIIRLHPLIREVASNECQPDMETMKQFCGNILEKISDYKYHDLPRQTVDVYCTVLEATYRKLPALRQFFMECSYILIDIYLFTGRYGQALEVARDLLNYESNSGSKMGLALAYYYIADIHEYFGDHDTVFKYFPMAVEAARKAAPYGLDTAFLLVHYAIRKVQSQRNLDEAEIWELLKLGIDAYHHTTEEKSRLLRRKESLLGSYHHCSTLLHSRCGRPEDALESAKKTFDYYNSQQERAARAWLISPISAMTTIYSQLGNREKAMEFAQLGVEHTKEYFGQTHFRMCRHLMHVAEACRNLDMPDEELRVWQTIKENLEAKNEEGTLYYQQILENIEKCKQAMPV